MTTLGAVATLAIFVSVLVTSVVFTVQTSHGNSIGLRILKFLGLWLSAVPVAAIIMYVIFRGRPTRYGERCAIMGIMGLGWRLLVMAARSSLTTRP